MKVLLREKCWFSKKPNWIKIDYHTPDGDDATSGGILAARANNVVKYTAQITLSAASPAAKTDRETPRASAIAT